LVRRGLVPTRHEAQAAIAGGAVLVAGAPATKPARLVAPNEPVVLVGPPAPFVSRGGEKLHAALDRFAVPVAGRRALDAGASTGGFTDCLLQRGAARVYAVDVGHGQLHARLRADSRVTVLERVNARTLTEAVLREADPGWVPVPLVVADLSFISLRTVVPALAGPVAASGADLVLLVKPQFEAGRAAVSRGKGVVRDPTEWLAALAGVASALHDAGTGIVGAMASPLTGPAGNVEFLVHARKGHAAPARDSDEVAALLSAAVSEAG
jgi:23S rRNA (cytidine1920-2'-O)/16S rRNA (cytidine1409-2'-O)-methyltransferase